MKGKLRVGIVFGGKSVEHEVSVVSARSVMDAIDKGIYEVVPIAVTKEGRWLSADDSARFLNNEITESSRMNLFALGSKGFKGLISVQEPSAGEPPLRNPHLTEGDSDVRFGSQAVDVVFPLIHGAYGEDGKLQGLLELADVPYVGAGPLSSALGMDKDLMKKLFTMNGIPVVDYTTVSWHEWREGKRNVAESAVKEFGLPLFIKPANTGSSVGISKVKEKADIDRNIDEAFRYDNKVIIEEAIDAREIECSVLGNEDPQASIPGEIVPCNEFYDYRAKYIDDRSELIIPAQLDQEQVKAVQDLAIRAFRTLECSGMARVDFFLDRHSNRIFVNELNTIPGFTPISMYPKLWEASGISYKELIHRLIELAMEKHKLNARLESSYIPEKYS